MTNPMLTRFYLGGVQVEWQPRATRKKASGTRRGKSTTGHHIDWPLFDMLARTTRDFWAALNESSHTGADGEKIVLRWVMMRDGGMIIREIAEATGHNANTVKKYLMQIGKIRKSIGAA